MSFLKKTTLTALVGLTGTTFFVTTSFLTTKSKNEKIEPKFLFNESLTKVPTVEGQEVIQVKKQKELDDFKEIAKSNMSGKLKFF